jgi:hypothetical protein
MDVFRSISGLVVLTNSGYMSEEYDELGEGINYFDIVQSPSYGRLKNQFKVRRLICRVCKLKFRTREETQSHISRNIQESRHKYNEKNVAKAILGNYLYSH